MSSVRQKVWNGKILIRVTVDEPESVGTQEYLLVTSRVSYLLIYLERVLAYFERYLDEAKEGEWWFEYEHMPVSFNQPIGLLHDLLVGHPSSEPWDLTLKRGEFPTSRILHFDDEHTLQDYWTNQFKESCFVRDGNAKAVMLLPQKRHEALWWGIRHSGDLNDSKSYDVFWNSVPTLFNNRRSSTSNLPLRLHIAREDSDEGPTSKTIQKLVQTNTSLKEAISLATEDPCIPILHGVEINKDVLLGELYHTCMYPDGFLHIALLPIDENED